MLIVFYPAEYLICKLMIPARLALVASLFLSPPTQAFSTSKPLPEGWNGVLQLGAQITTGESRTNTLSGSANFTYRSKRWENQLETSFLRSTSTFVIDRMDNDGNPILDANGQPARQVVKGKTNNRLFVGFQPRWYWQDKSYLFTLLDWETNPPADIDVSTRQIGGLGHKLWKSTSDYLAAEIGVGNKRLKQESETVTEGGIGYVGLKFVRKLNDQARVNAELDSDFGGENRFTRIGIGFAYKLTHTIAIKFKYASRMNSAITKPANPFDSSVDGEATVNLEIDIL